MACRVGYSKRRGRENLIFPKPFESIAEKPRTRGLLTPEILVAVPSAVVPPLKLVDAWAVLLWAFSAESGGPASI